MSVKLMDCTLRDGANVVGKGFSAEITDLVLDGLTACRVPIIELGNAGGIDEFLAVESTEKYAGIIDSELFFAEFLKRFAEEG